MEDLSNATHGPDGGAGGMSEATADEAEAWTSVRPPVGFDMEPLAEIALDLTPQWLIEGLMPSHGLHVLYGAPGTGKSFVALHAALHVATGRRWAGREVRRGGVVYVASEGGRNFRKRVVAARKALGIPLDAQFALITRAPHLGAKGDHTDELIGDIRSECRRLGFDSPRLVVLDTLSRSITDLQESSAQDIMVFVEHAQRIADGLGALVMPVHHCGKDESRGMRGSSALHGAVDAEWMVARDAETGVRHLSVEKMKDGPDRLRGGYDLEDVVVGTDLAGHPIATCVAKVYDVVAVEATAETRPGPQDDRFLAALRVLAELEGIETTAPGPAGKAVALTRLRAVLATSGALAASSEKAAATAFTRALAALARKGVIAVAGERVLLLAKEAASAQAKAGGTASAPSAAQSPA